MLPFGVFIVLLGLQQVVSIPAAIRFLASMAVILAVSREPLRGKPSKPLLSVVVGIAVFVIWVGPDVHRSTPGATSILFNNPIVGHPAGNTPPASKNDPVFLFFRIAISVIAVPDSRRTLLARLADALADRFAMISSEYRSALTRPWLSG